MFALSFSFAVPRAAALDLDGNDGLIIDTVASRDRNIHWKRHDDYGAQSATTRRLDLTEPDGIRAGNYLIYPEVGAAVVYDDNIYLRDSNKHGDWRSEVAGGVKFESHLPRHVLDFSLDGKVVNFARHSDQDYADVRAKLDGALHFDHAHTLSASILSEIEHEDRTDPSYPAFAKDPVQVFHNRAAVGITRDVGRLYGTLSASIEDWKFGDTHGFDGAKIDLSDRDTTTYATQLRFGYRFSPGIGFIAKVRGLHDDNRGNGAINADAWGYEALAGLTFEVNPLLRWRILGGYGVRDYTSKALSNLNTALLEADIEWLPTQRLTIYATVRREIAGSSDAIAFGGAVETSARLRAEYEIYHNIIAHGGVEFERQDYNDVDRRDDIYSLKAGVDYHLTKNWLVTIGYEYQVRDSTDDQLDMHRNLFRVGAKLRF